MSFWLSHDTSVADLRYVQNINDKPTDVSCMLLNKNNRHTTTVLIQNFIHQMVGQKVNNKTEKKTINHISLLTNSWLPLTVWTRYFYGPSVNALNVYAYN